MGTWGEFISELKIVNLKSQGIFVKVDEVLDLWEERNKLRTELQQLKDETGQERERCAREVEEFADACAAEPDQPEYIANVLRMAATLIRERPTAPPMAEEISGEEGAAAGDVPMAEEITGTEAAPMAEEVPMGEEPPAAEQHPS